MKRPAWWISSVLFAFLLFWLCSALVVGPDDTHTADPASPMLLVQYAAIPQDAPALPDLSAPCQKRFSATAIPLPLSAPLPEAPRDGNGWLITGSTWPRTVYAVCPPEGMPG